MIYEWINFIRQPEVRSHVIFLSDYDMLLTERLVQGVDVWLNTPRRPWEACGTSGMKVLVNGGVNLSELDGWWAEAYAPEVGWALGDGQEHDDDPAWDAVEADVLYDLLEREVIPEFYSRDESGIPTTWVKRIRESMARLTPRFSTNRSVREYTEQHYLPAATAYRSRAANNSAIGRQIVDWQHNLEQKWTALRFGEVNLETDGDHHVFEVQVYLDDVDPKAVRVELYADGVMDSPPVRQEWTRIASLLTARGVRRADGQPFSVEQLRGVVSRQIRRTGISASNRIEPLGNADEDKPSCQSLSTTKHKRGKQPAVAKQPGSARPKPVDRTPSAVERPDDIRAFMRRAARLRHSFDDAN